ncbi:snurportin-1 [Nylanderia fulva]|uniref:snurportin-1 n=1 Tax=Nylanderia fulva TaxID=613905 RepID=UPI0010FB0491|nr:snurportin-1 [Nylanderia fulva]
MATVVLDNDLNSETRETERRSFYKNRIKKDNFRLEFDKDSNQEERRKILLEYQKSMHRQEAFDAARGILQDLYFSELETEDVEECSSQHKYSQKYKKNRMMLSEWMFDVPQDFTENWIMVPCPKGKRTRIVSGRGTTKAYSRKGVLCDTFNSALPGGNPVADMHQSAVVDCIWIKDQQTYYILDVLYWGKLPFTNCEAECRLFWINSKICETQQFKECDPDTNKYAILPLYNTKCTSDLSTALTNLKFEINCIDGFLFYHCNAHYNFGCTPLVTWLKPYMLPEVFGIFVPSPLDEKPNDYINFEHFMQTVNAKKNNKKRIVNNFMEIEYIA